MEDILTVLSEKLDKELFTEEIQEKIKTQFEIAVNEKTKDKLKEKEEELEAEKEEEINEFKDKMVEALDAMIDEVAEKFLTENAVAIASEIKIEMAENVINSFKTAFTENYITVPENEVDVVAQLEDQAARYKERANSVISESLEMKAQMFELQKAIEFQRMTEGVSQVKRDEMLEMLEGLEVKDIEDFKRKVEIVQERVEKTPAQDKDKMEPIKEDLDKKTAKSGSGNALLDRLYG